MRPPLVSLLCLPCAGVSATMYLRWRREAGGVFSLDWFDGGHFFIRRQENQVLTAIVRKLMHPFSGVVRAATATA